MYHGKDIGLMHYVSYHFSFSARTQNMQALHIMAWVWVQFIIALCTVQGRKHRCHSVTLQGPPIAVIVKIWVSDVAKVLHIHYMPSLLLEFEKKV